MDVIHQASSIDFLIIFSIFDKFILWYMKGILFLQAAVSDPALFTCL